MLSTEGNQRGIEAPRITPGIRPVDGGQEGALVELAEEEAIERRLERERQHFEPKGQRRIETVQARQDGQLGCVMIGAIVLLAEVDDPRLAQSLVKLSVAQRASTLP